MSVVAIPSPPDAVITNRGIREDMCNCACIRQQLSQLLQQPVVQAYRYTEPTIQIECSHMGGTGSQTVRSHHSGALQTPLDAYPSTYHVKVDDDCTSASTGRCHLAADNCMLILSMASRRHQSCRHLQTCRPAKTNGSCHHGHAVFSAVLRNSLTATLSLVTGDGCQSLKNLLFWSPWWTHLRTINYVLYYYNITLLFCIRKDQQTASGFLKWQQYWTRWKRIK